MPAATSRCQLPIPVKVEGILGDHDSRKALAAEYFKNAHRWLPIISPIRFYGSLLMNPSQTVDHHGVTSILLAMKLVLSCPEAANVCSEMYGLVKEFQLHMEMAGHVSVYTLQSAILTAMYEMGHAIFPGAFTTISTCARHAIALGINKPLPVQGRAWMEQEERNRAWWAIVIMDRSINLGFRGRHLCRPDPGADSILPVDDDAYDQGVGGPLVPSFCSSFERASGIELIAPWVLQVLPETPSQNLLSIPSLKTGRYARLAQAVNLLSQVFRHLSSREDVLRLDLDAIAQLEKTLFALERLSAFEERERNICCLSSIATCYSSILLLRTACLTEPHKSLTDAGQTQQSQESIREVLAKTLGHFQRFRDGWGSLDRFPPLALDWLYRSAVAHVFLTHDANPSEGNRDLDELKNALDFVGQRWLVASE